MRLPSRRRHTKAGLVQHLEHYLGPIEGGQSADAAGRPMPFQVVQFGQGSGPGTTISFSTLGLGRIALPSPASGRDIRHEFLMSVPDSVETSHIPGLLFQIGVEALTDQRAVRRGDVIDAKGPLVPGSSMEALYASLPVYFPDDFATASQDGDSVVIVWLIPISAGEARYVHRHGWSAFEQLLIQIDPDLTDLFRTPLPVQATYELS